MHLVEDSDAEDWTMMLRDRNLSSHTYNAALADEIVDRLLARYLPCFRTSLVRTRKAATSG